MQKVAMIIFAAGLVASLLGAYQLLAGEHWFPVCEQHRYWYNWACEPYCSEMMSDCFKSGGIVACCQHYPGGSWECYCIWE